MWTGENNENDTCTRELFWKQKINRPLPSSKNPHFQNEAGCTTFLVKMSVICMRMKSDSHIKSRAPTLGPGNGLFWYRVWKLSGVVNPLVPKRSVVNLGRNIGRLPFTTVTLPFTKDILHFSIPVLHSRHWIPPHPKQYLVDLSTAINTNTK